MVLHDVGWFYLMLDGLFDVAKTVLLDVAWVVLLDAGKKTSAPAKANGELYHQ